MVKDDKLKRFLILAGAMMVTPMAMADCQEQLKSISHELYGSRAVDDDSLSVCKVWPYSPDKTIMVMLINQPENKSLDESLFDYDVDVVVTDTQSGKILARNYHPRAITNDAIALSSVTIDTARYQLTPELRAFGIRFNRHGASRVNPIEYNNLNLYVLKDKALPLMVNQLTVEDLGGEWDGDCAGYFDKKIRTISILKTSTSGFADLGVHEVSVHSEATKRKDECTETEAAKKQADYTLHFNGINYSVDKKLRLFDESQF